MAAGFARAHRTLLGVVALVAAVSLLVAFTVPGEVTGDASFRAGSSYALSGSFPAEYQTVVYLQANYTGLHLGSFILLVTYNTTSGETYHQQVNLSLASGSPYTYSLFLQAPQRGVLLVHFQVCRGDAVDPSALVYDDTVVV